MGYHINNNPVKNKLRLRKRLSGIGLFILFLLFVSINSFGQLPNQAPDLPSVNWVDWNSGINIAEENNKIILLYLYTEWCTWCKKMDKETYRDSEVVEIIDKYFVAIKMNPEQTSITYNFKGMQLTSKQLLKMLSRQEVLKYPAIIFYFPDQNEIYREEGFQKAKSFRQLLSVYVDYQKKTVNK